MRCDGQGASSRAHSNTSGSVLEAGLNASPRLRVPARGSASLQHTIQVHQCGFLFYADSGRIGDGNAAVLDRNAVGEASEWLKNSRIRFISSEPQSCGDVKCHLVTTMRNAAQS